MSIIVASQVYPPSRRDNSPLVGTIVGLSEDGLDNGEEWFVGGPDYDIGEEPNMLGVTLVYYLTTDGGNPFEVDWSNAGDDDGGGYDSEMSESDMEWEIDPELMEMDFDDDDEDGSTEEE